MKENQSRKMKVDVVSILLLTALTITILVTLIGFMVSAGLFALGTFQIATNTIGLTSYDYTQIMAIMLAGGSLFFVIRDSVRRK